MRLPTPEQGDLVVGMMGILAFLLVVIAAVCGTLDP